MYIILLNFDEFLFYNGPAIIIIIISRSLFFVVVL